MPSFSHTPRNRAFTKQQSISDHMKSSLHTPKFVCKTCSTTLPDQYHLEKHHMITGHGPQRQASKFHCGECNYGFARQSALNTHLGSFVHARTAQPTAPKYQYSVATGYFAPQPPLPPAFRCNKCTCNFVDRVALDKHLSSSIHVPKPVPVVPKPTLTASAAPTTHAPKPIPTGPRNPTTPNNYSRTTPSNSYSNSYQQTHSRIQTVADRVDPDESLRPIVRLPNPTPTTNAPTPTPPASRNPTPRPPPTITPNFPCNNCNKHHPTKHARDTHICACTSRCSECKRDFVNQYALRQHLVSSVHLMVPKPAFKFYCDECDMGFHGCEQMRRHMASSVHAGGFECEECREIFKTGDLLAMHVVVHVKGRMECPC